MPADPIVITDPLITINGLPFKCHARSVSLVPEDSMADVETFCAPGAERPGTTTWTCELELLLSFGTGAGSESTWGQLHPLRKTKQVIVIKPADTTTSVTNPSATFSAYLPSIPFMVGKIGESMPFTFTAVALGEPVFATT